MKCVRIKRFSLLLLFIYMLTLAFGVRGGAIHRDDNSVTAFAYSAEFGDTGEQIMPAETCGKRISSRFYELLFDKEEKPGSELYLIPGGEVFGIRIKEHGVTVNSAEEWSQLERGDRIISIDDTEVKESEDVTLKMKECRGGTVRIGILRGGEKMTLTVTPKYENGSYKLGVTLQRAACGIGTVTFVDPKTQAFGGLGHGICNPQTKIPVELESGEVCGVVLGGINRGEVGKPGELSGVLNKKHIGRIDINDECGVFGSLDDVSAYSATPIPVGTRAAVKCGEAEIISTVKNGKKATYKIEITEIDADSTGSKSFKIKVTDPTLIALTGGIVRGMSGSPIIQNGKLIGAVTHVMVANPTEGYGIFIENMLSAAENQVQPKAA